MDEKPGTVEPHTSADTLCEYGVPAAHVAERAILVADSQGDQAAAIVRVRRSAVGPRLLSFECSRLAVDVEVDGTGGRIRMLGQVIPAGSARIEVRQEHGPEHRFIDADRLGRFVVEDICAGSTSVTCHRVGERPVTTDWTSL